jgi:hypothetical protein
MPFNDQYPTLSEKAAWLKDEMAGLDAETSDRALHRALCSGVAAAPGLRELVEAAYHPPRSAPLGQLPPSRPRLRKPAKGGLSAKP